MSLSDDDVEEFQLQPETSRSTKRSADGTPITPSLQLLGGVEPDDDQPAQDGALNRDSSVVLSGGHGTSPPRDHQQRYAQNLYNDTAGLYPKERHYPTLEAMQRLSKLFGYATVLAVFPYLLFRFIWIVSSTEEGLLQELGQFSTFAVPVLFATVGLIGILFTASEGIKLAIDLQDNTLRIANRAGRRKE